MEKDATQQFTDHKSGLVSEECAPRLRIDFWRTRLVPTTGTKSSSTAIVGALKGVYPEYIYKTFEVTADGIIDFKLEEESKIRRDLIRIRSMRNVHFDREWHELKIGENFEVTLEK